MEVHRVARLEPRRLCGRDDLGAVRAIRAEEPRRIKSIGVERHAVRSRHQPQRAIVDLLFAQREPDGDKVLTLETTSNECPDASSSGCRNVDAWSSGNCDGRATSAPFRRNRPPSKRAARALCSSGRTEGLDRKQSSNRRTVSPPWAVRESGAPGYCRSASNSSGSARARSCSRATPFSSPSASAGTNPGTTTNPLSRSCSI